MKTENLRRNELDDDTYRWYLAYLTALDAKDIDAYGRFLASGVELIMGNAPALSGHDAVTTGLAQYWQTFEALEHDLLVILGSSQAFVLEAFNHYTTRDQRQVTLRAVAFTERDESGLVSSVRLYTDVGPLYDGASPGSA